MTNEEHGGDVVSETVRPGIRLQLYSPLGAEESTTVVVPSTVPAFRMDRGHEDPGVGYSAFQCRQLIIGDVPVWTNVPLTRLLGDWVGCTEPPLWRVVRPGIEVKIHIRNTTKIDQPFSIFLSGERCEQYDVQCSICKNKGSTFFADLGYVPCDCSAGDEVTFYIHGRGYVTGKQLKDERKEQP